MKSTLLFSQYLTFKHPRLSDVLLPQLTLGSINYFFFSISAFSSLLLASSSASSPGIVPALYGAVTTLSPKGPVPATLQRGPEVDVEDADVARRPRAGAPRDAVPGDRAVGRGDLVRARAASVLEVAADGHLGRRTREF